MPNLVKDRFSRFVPGVILLIATEFRRFGSDAGGGANSSEAALRRFGGESAKQKLMKYFGTFSDRARRNTSSL